MSKSPAPVKGLTVGGIRRHPEHDIILPVRMTFKTAREVLDKAEEAAMEPTSLIEAFPAYPWDGAIALTKALEDQFGCVLATATPGMFGSTPPQLKSIPIGPDSEMKVAWGRFTLPGVASGYVETGWNGKQFMLVSEVRRMDSDVVEELYARVRAYVLKESIYRGKAIELRFTDEHTGKPMPMPTPTFLRLGDVPPIFSGSLERAIETNVLTPIRHLDAVKAAGIPFKRGILLAGPYGTGKTMAAGWIAKVATANNVTYLYVPKVEELPQALEFAMMFQPCVIMSEDVDRLAGMERTDDVNVLLNTLDGIGNKSADIMTILTSNHAEGINPAMRRPGRIDVTLHIAPPDAEAVDRLIRFYAGTRLADSQDLSLVGEILEGQIPAVIREVVERSKLEALRRSHGKSTTLISLDLEATAATLLIERGLFQPAARPDVIERLGHALGDRMFSSILATARAVMGEPLDPNERVVPIEEVIRGYKRLANNSRSLPAPGASKSAGEGA